MNINNSTRKVVKPLPQTSQVLGKEDAVLQGAEVQELNNEDEDGQPILNKIQRDSCVLIQGKKAQPIVAIVKEVLWNGARQDVDLRVNELPRANDIESAGGVNQLRQVFFTEQLTTVYARKVLHPCKVFFLPLEQEPQTMATLLGKQHQRPRPGHLCWRLFDKQGKNVVPFGKLSTGTRAFSEVTRLIQRTNRELRKLEERENLPAAKRTGPLPGKFASVPADAALHAPKITARAAAPSLKPADSSLPAKSALGASDARKVVKSKEPEKAAPKPAVQNPDQAGAALAAKKPTAPKTTDTAKQGSKLPPSKPAPSAKGAAASQDAAQPHSSDGSSEEKLQTAAQSLAMRLELGIANDSVWDAIQKEIQVLLSGTGSLAEELPTLGPEQSAKKTDAAAAKAATRLPQLASVERLAKALLYAPQESQTKLADLGMFRAFGVWLVALPQAGSQAARTLLLRALLKAPCTPAFTAWIAHRGIFKLVVALKDAADPAVKDRATALKVHWQDELERQGLTDVAEQAVVPAVSASAADAKKPTPTPAATDSSEDDGQPIASLVTPKTAKETAPALREKVDVSEGPGRVKEKVEKVALPQLPGPSKKASSADSEATETAPKARGPSKLGPAPRPSFARKPSPAKDTSPSRKELRRHGLPEEGKARKTRNVTELHKSSPSATAAASGMHRKRARSALKVAEEDSAATASQPVADSQPKAAAGAVESRSGAALAQGGKAPQDASEPATSQGPGNGSQLTTGEEAEGSQPRSDISAGKQHQAEAAEKGSQASRWEGPDWSMEQITALRDRLCDDDRTALENIQNSHEHLPTYKAVVDTWIGQKMREYRMADTAEDGTEDEALTDAQEAKSIPQSPSEETEEELVLLPKKRKADAATAIGRLAKQQRAGSAGAGSNEGRESTPAATAPQRRTRASLAKLVPHSEDAQPQAQCPVSGGASAAKPGKDEKSSRPAGGASKVQKSKGSLQDGKKSSLVAVYAGRGTRRKQGKFDIVKEIIILQNESQVSPEQFMFKGDGKSTWREAIWVSGDEQNRTIGEWLADRCTVCDLPTHEAQMLICSNEKCERMYHTFCLDPPLEAVPSGDEDWFCPKCTSAGTLNPEGAAAEL